MTKSRLCVLLAALQAADLVATQTLTAYGDEHLDHLGVPPPLRPALPAVKLAAVAALLATRDRAALRSPLAAGLVAYYAAAVSFHRAAGDPVTTAAPAAACAALAAAIV